MYYHCHGTPIEHIAAQVKACVDAVAAEHPAHELYGVHVYLQGEDAEAGGGHRHYGVYADSSYGGTPEAVELVNAALPAALWHVLYDEEVYQSPVEAFADAYAATF